MVRSVNLERTLPAIGLFEGLARTHLAWLVGLAEYIELSRSETLFERGEKVERFYVLLHGHLKYSMTNPQAQEKVVEFFEPGHTFGENVLLPQQRWIGSAQALTPSRVLALRKDDLVLAMQQSHELSVRLLASASRRVEALLQDIESASFRTAAQRVAEYVLLQPRHDNETRLKFHKRTIASKLGLQPETFSRSLKQMVTDGLITVRGANIIIHDESGLKSMLQN